MKIPIRCPGCGQIFEIDNSLTSNLDRSVELFYSHIRSAHSTITTSAINTTSSAPPPTFPDSVIFQDPTQDHDVYISYCTANSAGGGALTSQFHDPKKITAELSKHFKPWIDNVCLGSSDSGDFYKDRALAIQKVKVVVAFVSPEYVTDEQCKMEYEFAFRSLNKPILPVIIRDGIQRTLIESYIRESELTPFRLDGAITSDTDFKTKMGYLMEAVKRMLTTTAAREETIRLSYLSLDSSAPPTTSARNFTSDTVSTSVSPSAPSSTELINCDRPPTYEEFLAREEAQIGRNINQGVPQVGDHVVSHHFKHAYYMATILKFDRHSMQYTIRWDDNDPSGRVQPVHKVALDRVPTASEICVGTRVFFPQGSYKGTEGNNSGGGRYHEGIISHMTGTENNLKYHGYHVYGEEDDKWVTYKDYAYNFCCNLDELRIAPNPYNTMMSYNRAPPPLYS